MCPLPRITILTHPDEVHEHTVASLAILGPTYLDNGDYVIEVRNDAGFERRTVNVQFQTELEYNEKFFRRYMEHKENFKLHEYGPGEEKWEDLIPEVREFHPYVPEAQRPKECAPGKVRKRRKKHRLIKKKVVMPWGDEEEHEVTDSGASSESYTADENEEEVAKEEEEEEDNDWLQGGKSDDEEEEPPKVEEPVKVEEVVAVEEVIAPVEEPIKEEEPVKEEEIPVEEEVKPEEPAQEVVEEVKPEEPQEVVEETPVIEEETAVVEEDEAWGLPPPAEDPYASYDEPQEIIYLDEYHPLEIKRKLEDPDYPRILRRPKFYITDFQLQKKFYFVNKLMDIELLKGKTLRLESISSSMGPVTAEWRFNGRIIGNTARRTIEFWPRKNNTAVEIENTRVQDSGNYTVTFYNNFTEPLIDTCKVTIVVPKPAEVVHQPPTFTRLLTGTKYFKFIKIYQRDFVNA